MLTIPSRVIASCFALVGFAAAAVLGAAAGNEARVILGWAILAMGACWVIGGCIGWVIQRTVEEHLEAYKQQHPIPDFEQVTSAVAKEQAEPTEQASASGAAITSS